MLAHLKRKEKKHQPKPPATDLASGRPSHARSFLVPGSSLFLLLLADICLSLSKVLAIYPLKSLSNHTKNLNLRMQTLDEQEHLGISKPNQVAGQAQGSLPEMQEPFIFCITSHF